VKETVKLFPGKLHDIPRGSTRQRRSRRWRRWRRRNAGRIKMWDIRVHIFSSDEAVALDQGGAP
jgi:hypothetical protein